MTPKQKAELFRSRFDGKPNVYGRGRITQREGKPFKQYFPVCDAFWSEGCHIRKKDGIICANCEIKEYQPVSDESVLKHINGEEEHIIYVLKDDDTIRFGAIDFDCKPGKEAKGYTFEDVRLVSETLSKWGIAHGIARSTTAGFHLYSFFEQPISPAKYRAIIYQCFEVVGFMGQHREGIRPIPEVFPKQEYISVGGIGNGIKPCMIEPQFEKERNCWITIDNAMIPANLQWDYFAKIPNADPAAFDKVIAEYALEINEHSSIERSSRARTPGSPGAKWEPPLTGSIEKVLEGCAALRRVKQKCEKGESPGHDEGFALYHLAMHTADGLDYFDKHVPGWGKTDGDRRQLDQSLNHNYAPWSCRTMQEKGVCASGTKCFDKKPPVEIIEGVTVERNVPKEQWPDPSPIRYAYGKGVDFLKALMREGESIAAETDESLKGPRLRELVARAQVFDKSQQSDLLMHLKKLKVGTKGELSGLFNKAGEARAEAIKSIAEERTDTVVVGDKIFKKRHPHGYSLIMQIQGKERDKVLCDFDLEIDEERRYRDDGELKDCTFAGNLTVAGNKYPFEVKPEVWSDSKKVYELLIRIVGVKFNPLVEDIALIKQAAQAFSENKTKAMNYLMTQGFEGQGFVTPDAIADKEGVRPNTELMLDLSRKQYACNINFQILSDSDLKEVLFHIKRDFIKAWPSKVVITGLAHAMMAPLIRPLKIRVRPTLFYEGESGAGKTQLQWMLMQFFGHFKSLIGFDSTGIGIGAQAYEFRDCLLAFNDYKELNPRQRSAVESLIQHGYDSDERTAANRSGEARSSKSSRCLPVLSGELFPSNDSSMVARTIIVEPEKREMTETAAQYEQCLKYCHLYNGVTPRFISWFLNTNHDELREKMRAMKYDFMSKIPGFQNNDRISENLSYNYHVWELFVGFMLTMGAVDEKEYGELTRLHLDNVKELLISMSHRCAEEKNAGVFVETLITLLSSQQVAIKGLRGFEPEHVPIIGFIKEGEPDRVFLFSKTAIERVLTALRHTKISLGERAIGRQLAGMGVIVDHEAGRFTKVVWHNSASPRVWVMSRIKLGLRETGPHIVGNAPVIEDEVDGIV